VTAGATGEIAGACTARATPPVVAATNRAAVRLVRMRRQADADTIDGANVTVMITFCLSREGRSQRDRVG
jgi:hypothetical protein